MGITMSVLQPQDLIAFKNLPETVPLSAIQIPERAENRKPTNVKWLISMGIFFLIFVPFMIYTLYYSDLRRFLYGYDNCGNVCGVENCAWDGIPCSGKDYSAKHLLKYANDYHGARLDESSNTEKTCVQSCGDGHINSFGKCLELKYKSDNFGLTNENNENSNIIANGQVNYSTYILHVKWQIIISCLLSILIAIGMMFLYRYAMAVVVWSILIMCLLGLGIASVVLWVFYGSANPGDPADGFLSFAIGSTVFTITLLIIVLWCRNKIRLIILLFKEAARAIFDMPMLIAVSIVNVIIICFSAFLYILLTICFLSAGKLMLNTFTGYYDYVKNPAMIITIVYNTLVALWIIQFFVGAQYMIVSGAVLRWYFSRQKYGRFQEITESILVTVKYHLGTVALGSLINLIVIIIKSIIVSLSTHRQIRRCLNYFLSRLQNLVKLLSKNAYIITALHGQPFLKSGKRAATILLQNIDDIIAINYIGYFVLVVCKLLIIIISILLGMLVFYWYPSTYNVTEASGDVPALTLIGLFALLVSYMIFQVFEATVDSLFISFCEDKLLNDGITQEYFMSTNMFNFIEGSKKLYRKN